MSLAHLNQTGVVIAVRTRMLGTMLQVGDEALDVTARGKGIQAKAHLINRDYLLPIVQAANKARKAIRRRSVQFMKSITSGLYWAPNALRDELEAEFAAHKREFEAAADQFRDDWDVILREAEQRLGQFYDPSNYPSIGRIRQYFDLRLAMFQLQPVPGLDRREMTTLVDEFKEDTRNHLRTMFTDLLDHIVERLTPERDQETGEMKKKIFRNSLVTNLQEFLQTARHLNVSNDQVLNQQLRRMEELMEAHDVTPERLRDDRALATTMRQTTEAVRAVFASSVTEAPRRQVRRRRKKNGASS